MFDERSHDSDGGGLILALTAANQSWATPTISDCGDGSGTIHYDNPADVAWTCDSVCQWESDQPDTMSCDLQDLCSSTEDNNSAYMVRVEQDTTGPYTTLGAYYVFFAECQSEVDDAIGDNAPVGNHACCIMQEDGDHYAKGAPIEILEVGIRGTDLQDAIGFQWGTSSNTTPTDQLSPIDASTTIEGTQWGEGGNDYLLGTSKTKVVETFRGGDGNDDVRADGGGNTDTLYGEDGDDVLLGQGGPDEIYGGKGKDWIAGGKGGAVTPPGGEWDYLYGGGDPDRICAAKIDYDPMPNALHWYRNPPNPPNIYFSWTDPGTYFPNGTTCLTDDNGPAEIEGGPGNDYIQGGEWGDTIEGNAGNDTIYGGEGDDGILPGAGTDVSDGQAGDDDICENGDDNNEMYGGANDDRLFHTAPFSTLTMDGGPEDVADACNPATAPDCESAQTSCPLLP